MPNPLIGIFLIMSLMPAIHAQDVEDALVVDVDGVQVLAPLNAVSLSLDGSPAVSDVLTDPSFAAADDTQVPTAAAVKAYVDATVSAGGPPAGSVFWFASSTPPNGYLICDGRLVSRTDYADLFAAIGTTFGPGDGSTNFALPDLRGEFVRGFDQGRGVDGGRGLGSWQADQFKSHHHGWTGQNGTGYPDGSRDSTSAGSDRSYARKTQVLSQGGHETRPRNIALLPVIKH